MTHNHHDHELHDDDKPIGRVLTRREMLKLLGGGSIALLTGLSLPQIVRAQTDNATPAPAELPSCVVRPELAAGPYFVDNELNRFDIRVEQANNTINAGAPFLLMFNVTAISNGQCAPLPNAQVDIWHCDADGVYSGVRDRSFTTVDELWFRGYQITDELGTARFLTIIPGWYPGRAVHIHFKIRTEPDSVGDSYDFTSQLFFDPEFIADVYNQAPYIARGLPDTPNERDGIFRRSADQLTLDVVAMDDEQLVTLADQWYAAQLAEAGNEDVTIDPITFDSAHIATFNIGLDLTDARSQA